MYFFIKRKDQTDLQWLVVTEVYLRIKAMSVFSNQTVLMTKLHNTGYEVYPVKGTIRVQGSAMTQREVIDYARDTFAEWNKEGYSSLSPKQGLNTFDEAVEWLKRNNHTLEPDL